MIGGFDVDCSVTPHGVNGRIGGLLRGADVDLSISHSGMITGRLGGGIFGQDVRLRMAANEIGGRVGGDVIGKDVQLKNVGSEIGGRVGGDTLGFSCMLKVNQDNSHLMGRLGGEFMGHDVSLVVEDVTPILGALVAVLTYHYYLFTRKNSGNSGGSR